MTVRVWATLGFCSSLALTGGSLLTACAPSWGSPAWPTTSRAVETAPPAIAALRVKIQLSEYAKSKLHDENVEFIVAVMLALREAGIEEVGDLDDNGHEQAYDFIIETMYDERTDSQHSDTGASWFWTLRPVLTDRDTRVRSGWRARFDAGAGLAASAPWGSGTRADSKEADRLIDQLSHANCSGGGIIPDRAKGDSARGPHGEPSEGHRRAATHFVNLMTACPELARVAQFIGSHGALARDLKPEIIDRLNAHWDNGSKKIVPPSDPFYFDRGDDPHPTAPDEPSPTRGGTPDTDPSEATTSEDRAQMDEETRDVANAVDATARSFAEERARLGEAARKRRRQNGGASGTAGGGAGLPGPPPGSGDDCGARRNACLAVMHDCIQPCESTFNTCNTACSQQLDADVAAGGGALRGAGPKHDACYDACIQTIRACQRSCGDCHDVTCGKTPAN